MPPTSAVLCLHSLLPNTTQSFDNLQPAWLMLELRVGLHQAEWCIWHVWGMDCHGEGRGQATGGGPWQHHEFQQGQVQGPSDRTSDNDLKLEEGS